MPRRPPRPHNRNAEAQAGLTSLAASVEIVPILFIKMVVNTMLMCLV